MFIFGLIFLILLFSTTNIEAKKTEKNDVTIDPDDYTHSIFWTTDKGEKIDITVESDIPVDVYIITNDDFWDDVIGTHDYSDAKHSEIGVTSKSFTFTCPDDQLYYLVIANPSITDTATVDYEYENITEKEALYPLFNCICGFVIIVIIVVVLIVYFWYRKRKQQVPPQQYPYPPQQPPYPPQTPP